MTGGFSGGTEQRLRNENGRLRREVEPFDGCGEMKLLIHP